MGEPSAAVFALRHSPRAGRRQAARGESCATSSPDGDRPVGWRPPCPAPVPGSARSRPAKRDFGGRVGFRGTTPALRCRPPPGTPPSQFSPSPAQLHLAPGTPHALLALYPLFWGDFPRPESWEELGRGSPVRSIGPGGAFTVEETWGSFLSSPVELGAPAAPEGRFPHGGGVPGVPPPREISLGIPNYGSRYFPAYCIPYFHPKRDPRGAGSSLTPNSRGVRSALPLRVRGPDAQVSPRCAPSQPGGVPGTDH